MKRRHTSMVAAECAARSTPVGTGAHAAGANSIAPEYAQALRQWALRVARKVVLDGVPPDSGAEDEPALPDNATLWAQRQKQRHAEVARRWRIATRLANGSPTPSGVRSNLDWFRPDDDERYYWRKVYTENYGHLQANEQQALLALNHAASANFGLHQHVGWFRKISSGGRGTSLAQLETLDAGPNLDMWHDFAPCVGTGQGALPLPLFAHPTFLAALTRQALIALEALALAKVVHGDVKPANLCLALPSDLDPSLPLIRGRLDLRQLPLRLIDFEFSFIADRRRRAMPLPPPQVVDGQTWEHNVNFSPFVHACHRAAAEMGNLYEIEQCLGAIDWGADLWALGDMLEQHTLGAKAFIAAYGVAFSSNFGPGSPEHLFADQALAGLLQDCGQLLWFAAQLKAHERDVCTAGQRDLPDRTDHPHERHWLALERLFPALGPRMPPASSVWTLTFINPAIRPGDEDAAPPLPPKLMVVRKGVDPARMVDRASRVPADLTELIVPNGGAACPSFILIPNAGKVTLGNGKERYNEAMTTDIRHRYAMGKTAVTVGQWKAFWTAGDRDYDPVDTAESLWRWSKGDGDKCDRHPMRGVNVADAEAYARWFAKKHGTALGVRIESIGLPTELEWELAARGGRYVQKYQWDEGASVATISKHANFGGPTVALIPVGTLLPNGYNLYDMIGNIWEWTASPWRDKRGEIPSNGREDAAGVSSPRVVRGASFGDAGDWLALGHRSGVTPGVRNSYIGFRLVARIAP